MTAVTSALLISHKLYLWPLVCFFQSNSSVCIHSTPRTKTQTRPLEYMKISTQRSQDQYTTFILTYCTHLTSPFTDLLSPCNIRYGQQMAANNHAKYQTRQALYQNIKFTGSINLKYHNLSAPPKLKPQMTMCFN